MFHQAPACSENSDLILPAPDRFSPILAKALEAGVSFEEGVIMLRDCGAAPDEVINAIRNATGLPAGAARQIFDQANKGAG